MEKLYRMLRTYNINHKQEQQFVPWARQFTKHQFPKYWGIVYEILHCLEKKLKVIEIGCGLGDVTAILCYLGYFDVVSFERDERIAILAQHKIQELFNHEEIIKIGSFPSTEMLSSDLLILVNCAYKECAKTKQEYIDLMKRYYEQAGSPQYFLMEVIDSAYIMSDEEFPECIRLSRDDVRDMFPFADIKEWQTYRYPQNSKSKTLYLITKA